MLIPTLGCPARCRYCWSSEEGSPVMSIDTVRETVEWLKGFQDRPVTVTFHGGEPLLAGADFYRQALPLIAEGLRHLTPAFAMQSNLWKLTPELADILAEYHVPIGTSIDGPPEINDAQRGEGYFDRTMKGYEIARAHGLRVSFICTFTSRSVKERDAIYRFFRERGFTMKLHPALPSLRDRNPDQWALDPVEYGDLLVFLLDRSLDDLDGIEVMNITDLVKCVFTRRGTVCTFADCMGTTYAVGPDGSIYPCYRFVGMEQYAMGSVRDRPTRADLDSSPAGMLFARYREHVDQACRECAHLRYCRGGCPYNALVPSRGEIQGVDPMCPAYRRIFDEITERLNQEMMGACVLDMGGPRPATKGTRPGIMALMRRIVSR